MLLPDSDSAVSYSDEHIDSACENSPESLWNATLSKATWPGAVAMIHSRDDDRILLQLKDDGHPDVRSRGRFAFFGGSIERCDTTYRDGLIRELREEILDGELIDDVVQHLSPWRLFEGIESYDVGISFDCAFFEAALPSALFDRVESLVFRPGVVVEGFPYATSKTAMRRELGSSLHFIFDLNRIARLWLEARLP